MCQTLFRFALICLIVIIANQVVYGISDAVEVMIIIDIPRPVSGGWKHQAIWWTPFEEQKLIEMAKIFNLSNCLVQDNPWKEEHFPNSYSVYQYGHIPEDPKYILLDVDSRLDPDTLKCYKLKTKTKK
jgi:hypothetical protein